MRSSPAQFGPPVTQRSRPPGNPSPAAVTPASVNRDCATVPHPCLTMQRNSPPLSLLHLDCPLSKKFAMSREEDSQGGRRLPEPAIQPSSHPSRTGSSSILHFTPTGLTAAGCGRRLSPMGSCSRPPLVDEAAAEEAPASAAAPAAAAAGRRRSRSRRRRSSSGSGVVVVHYTLAATTTAIS